MISIRRAQLPLNGIESLLQDSITEGYPFVERLQEEWSSGLNRFSAQGESLYCAFDDEELVAIGGLNRDPFTDSPHTGRLRRIYVRPAWRKRGIGTSLISALLRDAAVHFQQVRLRTDNPDAARLYEKFGFEPLESQDATHVYRPAVNLK